MFPVSVDTAKTFFRSLRQVSVEFMRHKGLPTDPGKKVRRWKYGYPKGLIMHYTAGVGWESTINHLNGAQNPKSSCHFLVLDRHVDGYRAFSRKHLILESLPVSVFMLSDLDRGTFHATWANEMCVGIENRNAGLLRKIGGGWKWWPADWTTDFPHNALGKAPVMVGDRWWEPYTRSQLIANIVLGRMLNSLYQGTGGLDPSWVLPHSAIEEVKYDTGRAYPFNTIRAAALNGDSIRSMKWLSAFVDPSAPLVSIEDPPPNRDNSDRSGGMESVEYLQSIAMPSAQARVLVQRGGWERELDAVRTSLHQLGYWVGCAHGSTLDPTTKLAVWQFQKAMGLDTDGIPGEEQTQPALAKRLKTFGFIAE